MFEVVLWVLLTIVLASFVAFITWTVLRVVLGVRKVTAVIGAAVGVVSFVGFVLWLGNQQQLDLGLVLFAIAIVVYIIAIGVTKVADAPIERRRG